MKFSESEKILNLKSLGFNYDESKDLFYHNHKNILIKYAEILPLNLYRVEVNNQEIEINGSKLIDWDNFDLSLINEISKLVKDARMKVIKVGGLKWKN